VRFLLFQDKKNQMICGSSCEELFYFYVEQQRISNYDTEKFPKLIQYLDCSSSATMAVTMLKKFKIHGMKIKHMSNIQIIICPFFKNSMLIKSQ